MNIAIKLTLPALLLVGTAILGWPGGQALAQGTSAGALEEITVTARRREESLIDTPVSITAFSAQDIQDRRTPPGSRPHAGTPLRAFLAHRKALLGDVARKRGDDQVRCQCNALDED